LRFQFLETNGFKAFENDLNPLEPANQINQHTMKDITCKTCHKIVYGRNNQIYCSQKCKNEFHNDNYREKHRKALSTLKQIMTNAKKIESLYRRHGSMVLKSKVFINQGLEPAFTNYNRTDGFFDFDDWSFKEIGEDAYMIIPPINFKEDER
jgi:hypothetical protein